MKRFLFTIALFLYCFLIKAGAPYSKVCFYVVAHPDDWQLFMGDRVFNDVTDTSAKVVIIHTTSGDASCGRPVNRKYYKAREAGALNSLEFCADIRSLHQKRYSDTVNINNHRLRRFANKNVVNYFLMIPDGCLWAGWNGESLEYLNRGYIKSLLTIDSTNIYPDWEDLVNTIQGIMIKEAGYDANIYINVPDLDTKINPSDHPDHRYSALAGLQAAREFKHLTTRLYVDYYTALLPINLDPATIALKGALYALADFGITQNGVKTKWFDHQEFITRTYYRTLTQTPDSLISAFLGITAVENVYLYPNPAYDACYLDYKLKKSSIVEIKIYDGLQNFVQEVMAESKDAGYYTKKINLTGLAKGSYILTIQTSDYQESIRLVKY